jgi:hypothetical protein
VINVKEIRIGNYYKYPNSKPFIVCLKDMGESSFLFEDDEIIESIQLTDEILLNCGFYKNKLGNVATRFIHENFKILFDVVGETFVVSYANQPIKEIKYLHQLQNLFFDLTGEELKFKTAILE